MEFAQDSPFYIHSVPLATTTPIGTTMDTKEPGSIVVVDNVPPSLKLRKHGKGLGTCQQLQQQPTQQQHKKQVRRRLHTSRPYQERLLNMAEARKEIVTALKYHRAAMKQASLKQQQQQLHQLQQHHHQQQQQQLLSLQSSHLSSFEQDERFKSKGYPSIYPSCNSTNFSNYIDDIPYSSFSHPPPSVLNSYTNPVITSPPDIIPPPIAENSNFTFPNQTLGLNHNLHHFNNSQAPLFLNNYNNESSLCSYSPLTSSPPPPLSVTINHEFASIGTSNGEGVSSVVETIESNSTTEVNRTLHTAMDDESMTHIRSLAEQYQMEWNDTMSLVTSAWWLNLSKNMEHDAQEAKIEEDGAYHNISDELIESSAWLNNANDNYLQQCSEDYFLEPTLHW